MHRDTPDNTGKTPDQEPQRLNNKMKVGFEKYYLRKSRHGYVRLP